MINLPNDDFPTELLASLAEIGLLLKRVIHYFLSSHSSLQTGPVQNRFDKISHFQIAFVTVPFWIYNNR